MTPNNLKPLYTAADIRQKIIRTADRISADYRGLDTVLIGVLKGAFVFMADLARHLSLEPECDFVAVTSYGAAASPGSSCTLQKDIGADIAGRHILLVEDIVDTGETVHFLKQHFAARCPKSLKVCALINKHARRGREVQPDYSCFTIKNGFVVGFGLDHAESYRCLPGIYELVNA